MDLTKPTFIIGLGGIGHSTVLRVARMFHDSDWEGVPPSIRIRSIDTAEQQDIDNRVFLREYATRLGGFSAGELIANIEMLPWLKPWWTYRMNLGFIDNGAGARRPVGRLVFFADIQRIVTALSSDFQSPLLRKYVEHHRVKNTAHVFIVGSLAGGTCSGMFLDTAILVRHLLQKNGYEPSSIWITGIFALPSIIELEAHRADTMEGRFRQLNAFGALKELDFLMGGWDPSLEIAYPQPVGTIHPAQPIFNSVLLVAATDAKSHIYTNQNEVLARMARYIYGHIAAESGRIARGILDNIYAQLNPDDRRFGDGQQAIYGSFGVEWLEVPKQYLLGRWSNAVGPRVAELVADFDWESEPKVNLGALVREKLVEGLGPYRRALQLIETDPRAIENSSELSGVQVGLDRIAGAESKSALETALHDYLLNLPNMTSRVKNLVRELGTAENERDWILRTIRELVSDRKFRLGGAKRFLEEAARELRKINERPPLPPGEIPGLVSKSKRVFSRTIDIGPSLEFSRARLRHSAAIAVQEAMGDRAVSLGARCETWAQRLGVAQRAVRDATNDFERTPEVETLPPEMWLLDKSDIDAAVEERRIEVEFEVADKVARVIAQTLTEEADPTTDFLQGTLPVAFVESTRQAINIEVAKRTKRPPDSLERLKRRVQQCVPMARIHESGPHYRDLMPEAAKPTPIQLVLTGMYGDNRGDLDAWQSAERAATGQQDRFQVEDSKDPLLDEAVTLSLGWPLALYTEIEQCTVEAKRIETEMPDTYPQHAVMNECAGALKHDFMPMPPDAARTYFGLAFIAGHIDVASAGDDVFARFHEEVFPGGHEVRSTWASVLTDAFLYFRRRGFAGEYARRVNAALKGERAAALAYRDELRERLQKRQSLLDEARPKLAPAFVRELEAILTRSAQYLENTILL